MPNSVPELLKQRGFLAVTRIDVEGNHSPVCVGLRLQNEHPEAAFRVTFASLLPRVEARAGSGVGLVRATPRHGGRRVTEEGTGLSGLQTF